MKELFIETAAQRAWLDKLETIREPIMAQAQANDEAGGFPTQAIEALRALGYMKLTLPTSYGGEGFNVYDAVLMQETLSSFEGSTGLITCWTLQNVGDIFAHSSWSEEAKARLAAEVVNGAMLNKAVSEFAMGSPTRGGRPATHAVRDGAGWRINGRKNYMTGSYALNFFLTLAWIEEKQTVGFFFIPKEAQGVSIEENWHVSAMRSTGSHDLILENVYVDAAALVDVPSASTGFKSNAWLLLIPATYLGIAQAARDYAVSFANTHAPNSLQGPIAQLPHIQALIGEIDLQLLQIRYAIYGAARQCVEQPTRVENTFAVHAAKHTVANGALQIVDKAMRIVGAKSLQLSCPLQRYYRDVRAGLHNPPMDDTTIQLFAQHALK